MTFIEAARLYARMNYPESEAIRDILKVYDQGEVEHRDVVLRICTVFSDLRYEKERELEGEQRVISERYSPFTD